MTWTTRPRSEISEGLSAWRAGCGLPLVLLHGVGLNADAWNGQRELLAEHFELIAIDMPGHGLSPRLVAASSLADYSDKIVEAIHRLGEPVLLGGHSMGAMLALDIAVRYPDTVLAVAALNAVFQRNEEASKAVRSRAAALTGDHDPDPRPTLKRWFGESLDSPEARACRHWLESVNPKGYQQAYQIFAHETGPTPAGLGALTIPALFMTGAEEPNSTPAMSQAMAELVPQGQAEVLPGAAHMMPMTHASLVSQHLLSFFTFALEIVDDGEL